MEFTGRPGPHIFAKDMVLKMIGTMGTAGGSGFVLEYAGEAVRGLSMEGRMTVCNMSIEAGARAGTDRPRRHHHRLHHQPPACLCAHRRGP